MKKIICIIIILCVVPFVCMAETDLSSMSYNELVELNHKLTEEIISRPEWKEVVVPSGTWVVGDDIPVGSYSISPGESGGFIEVRRSGKTIMNQGIRDKNDAYGKFVFLKGDYIRIERGSLVFAPPKGLGF